MKEGYEYLYFQNGKPKKKYMRCLSREKIAELRRIHGRTIIQCAGLECPFYAIGCGKEELKKFE